MLCQSCGNHEAGFHVKTSINGNASELHLCPECAAKMGMTPQLNAGSGLFGSMLSDIFGAGRQSRGTGAVCSFCGASERDIRKSGKVGCAHCYEEFSSLLEPYIRQIHGNALHTGKAPSGAGEAIKAKRKLESLKSELHAAIDAQEYERAAELRDQIRELEGGEVK